MEKTFEVINRMKADGIIDDYALGGAMGAIFYVDPFSTEDIDIIFSVKGDYEGNALDILAPIYAYLQNYGYKSDGVMIIVEGWPVQFLPVYKPLVEEAVEQAKTLGYKEVPVRVIRPEHLVAIMLDTGRPKDYARISTFLESDVLNMSVLSDILSRYDLAEKWEEKKSRFSDE